MYFPQRQGCWVRSREKESLGSRELIGATCMHTSQEPESSVGPCESEAKKIPPFELILLGLLVGAYFAWFAWPLVGAASENFRLVSAFVGDEAIYADRVAQLLDLRTLHIDVQDQGHLYLYLALFPLLLLRHFAPVSQQSIILALRMVSLALALATVIVTFLIARRYFGRVTGWLAVVFLCLTPYFWVYGTTARTDIPQVSFLVLCLYFCCRLAEDRTIRYLVYASVSAALAFGCKYVGAMMLPVLWVVVIVQAIAPRDELATDQHAQFVGRFAWFLILAAGILCFVLGLTVSPGLVTYYTTSSYGSMRVGLGNAWSILRIPVLLTGCLLMGLAILRFVRKTPILPPRVVDVIVSLILSVITFSVAAFLTSPLSFENSIRGLAFHSALTSYGHAFAGSDNRLLWFNQLFSPQLFGRLLFGLAVIDLAYTVYSLVKSRLKKLTSPEFVLWLWVVLYLVFLLVQIKKRSGHYLLPIIPPLVILAARPVGLVVECVQRRLPSPKAMLMSAFVVVAVVLGLVLSRSSVSVFRYRNSVANWEADSVYVRAGRWLAERYPPSVRILSDAGSYIPPSFQDWRSTWEPTLWILDSVDPDVVVIVKRLSERFSDTDMADKYVSGSGSFMRIHEYYQAFEKDRVPGYELVRDFGDVRIYARPWPETQTPSGAYELETEDSKKIKLRGYLLESELVRPDDTLKMELFWQIDQSLPPDTYGVFLHLRDDSQRTIAQTDWHFLEGKRFPMVTQHLTTIPGDTPSGEYEVRVGVYRTDTMERLAATEDVSGENAIILDKVTVIRTE